jgi:hypothetical protein
MSRPGAQSIEQFREFARRMSIADRMHRNARHTSRSIDRTEHALSLMQAIEAEFGLCFALRRLPDWRAVEAKARGDMP